MPQTEEADAAHEPEVSAKAVRVLMPSPIGPIGIELTGTAVTLLRIDPPEPELVSFIPLQRIDGSDFLDEVFGRLSEYFAGARRKIELAVDFGPCGASVLVRRVLKETTKIPYGKTRTYQVLAETASVPEGAPQVAAILRENPLPILVPCHRAVADSHRLGEYVGGLDRKRWLLELERQSLESA